VLDKPDFDQMQRREILGAQTDPTKI
jgi:hypothetical protein